MLAAESTGGVSLRAVAEENGEPLPGARLVEGRQGLPAESAGGASDGRVVATGLGAGTRYLRVGAPGRATLRVEAEVVAGGVTDLGDIRLPRTGRIAGVLRATPGESLEGVLVMVKASVMPDWAKVVAVMADKEGRFLLERLPPGIVVVEVEGGGRQGWIETVEVPAGGEAALEVGGGPVSIQGVSRRPGGEAADIVAAFPWVGLADPLAVFGPLAGLRVAGLRVVDPGEDGAYEFRGLPPGRWLVANELSHSIVRLDVAAAEPVHLDLLPRFVAGRASLPEGADRPGIRATAVVAGALENALKGGGRRMVDVLLAAWRGEEKPGPIGDDGSFSLPVPAEGRYLVFLHAEGFAAEGPLALDARAEPGPPEGTAALRPAATLRVVVADPAPEEVVAVAVRDDRGALASFRAKAPPVEIALLPGRFQVLVLRGGGRRTVLEVFLPTEGEVEVQVP